MSALASSAIMTSTKNMNYAMATDGDSSTEFKFGINYISAYYHYEPRYLTEDVLNRDFALFKQQGLTYITLLMVWKYFEPGYGQYNYAAFADLRRVCEFASKYSLQVIIDIQTQMFANSPKIPDWVRPRMFATVFANSTVHQGWIDFLRYTASYLNDTPNICSWHMMNEPATGSWAGGISIDQWIPLWTEMRNVFKSYSDRPVSIRFGAKVFANDFHSDPRIYNVTDYVALNWYEDQGYDETSLAQLIPQIQEHERVMISEFGYNKTTDDSLQAAKFREYITLFEKAGVEEISAWIWWADSWPTFHYTVPNPPDVPGIIYNLAKSWDGTPRSAFYLLKDIVPPIINVQSPVNGTYYTENAISLNFTLSEHTSWIGYSLDGQPNQTIAGRTTLIGLSSAYHSLVIYAEDIAGNVGTSNKISFLLDTRKLSVSLDKSTVNTGDTVTIQATLTDNGTGLSGQTVVFAVGGNTIGSGMTDSLGRAEMTYAVTLTPNSYMIQVTYQEAGNYTPTISAVGTIQIISPSFLGLGTTGTIILVAAIAAILAAIVYTVARKRPKPTLQQTQNLPVKRLEIGFMNRTMLRKCLKLKLK
jgi:hypothetical protein